MKHRGIHYPEADSNSDAALRKWVQAYWVKLFWFNVEDSTVRTYSIVAFLNKSPDGSIVMQFSFKPLTESDAQAIANWHYDGEYVFYDMDQDPEDLADLLDPENWKDKYCGVFNEDDELIGFFCFEQEGEALEIGLGLRPDCTGRGWGLAFFEAGLAYAKQRFAPAVFRLSVAAFNRRAIRVYEKAGFKPDGVFINTTNGGQYEFLGMIREA